MKRLLSICCVLYLSIFAGVAFSSPQPASPDTKDQSELAVAAAGYAHNVESFRNFRCRFVINDYEARTLKEAIEGKFVQSHGPVIEGLWIVKGRCERYLLTCDGKIIQDAKDFIARGQGAAGQKQGAFPSCMAKDYLSNGEYHLDRGIFMPVAHLAREGEAPKPPGSSDINPLRLGHRSPWAYPDALFRKCIEGNWYGRFEGIQEVLGRQAMTFACGKTKGAIDTRYFLDPERGFMPIRDDKINPATGKRYTFALVTNFRSCGDGRWFPERSLTFTLGNGPDGPPYRDVREIKLKSLDLDIELDESEFALTIPNGYTVSMPPNPFSLISTDKDTVVRPSTPRTCTSN
jgi:hypothetical protein